MDLQQHEINEWLHADNKDNGYRQYADDQIASEVMPLQARDHNMMMMIMEM